MLPTTQPLVQLPTEYVEGDALQGVSSPKLTEPVQNLPQTITVIPPEVYNEQGAVSLSDVLRNTPGITFFAGEGGSADRTGGDSFYLRGYDTSNSIFVDGVRDEGAATHDTFDLGNVEVFKGPSPENGRGGTAGYINLETKMPEQKAFADAMLTDGFSAGGSRALERATLDINQPLSDADAFRLDLMDQQGGLPGRQYAEKNRWGIAPSLAFGLGTPTRAFLSYEHQYEHNLPDYGLPATAVEGLAPPATPPSPSFFSPGVSPSTFYGFVNDDFEQIANDAVTARVEHDIGSNLAVSNQLRYDNTSRLVEASAPSGSVTSAPAGEASIQQGLYQTENRILSDQTNLTADLTTGPFEHTLTSGLEISREEADNPIWAVVPPGAPSPAYLVDIYDPLDFPASLPGYDPHPTGSSTETRIDTEALYAFDTVKIRRHWEVSGGVRLEHYDVDELSVTTASPAVPAVAGAPGTATIPATAATSAVAAVPASVAELGAIKTTLAGKIGAVYKPDDDTSLYVSYGNAVRPPGTSTSTNTLSTTTTSADNPLLQPEKSTNLEVGAKEAFFSGRLSASAALFRSVTNDVPSTDPVTGLVDQTSDQTVQGVELSVSGKITRQWSVLAGYSRMEARVSDEISANAQGLTLPLLPKESANLWTTYSLPHGLTVGAGLQYMGATERLQATGAPTATTFANGVPSFAVANAMISYALNKHLSLRLNANNVANREYITSLNNNGYRVNLGAPRNFLLTAELKF